MKKMTVDYVFIEIYQIKGEKYDCYLF